VALVREGVDRDYPVDRIAARLGTGQSTFVLDSSASVADITAQVVVERDEARLPLLFDGVRSIEDVVRATTLPELLVQKIAFTLFCFGVLRPVEADGVSRGIARMGLRDLGIERERIQARYALANDSDYFCVLGMDRFADVNDIGKAHARLCKEIDPETLGPELWHEQRQQIETIREVLDEALRVLSTPALRSAYEFNLAHGPDAEDEPETQSPASSTPIPARG
jgi:hypothetical protein